MSSAADDVYRRDVFYFVQTVPPAALNDAGRARLRDIANSFLQTTQNAEMQALLALVHGIYDLRPYMTPANLNPVVRNVLQVTNNAAVQVQTARSRTTVNPTSVMTTTTTALATAMPTGSLTWVSTSESSSQTKKKLAQTVMGVNKSLYFMTGADHVQATSSTRWLSKGRRPRSKQAWKRERGNNNKRRRKMDKAAIMNRTRKLQLPPPLLPPFLPLLLSLVPVVAGDDNR
jgi:hypothetical protein